MQAYPCRAPGGASRALSRTSTPTSRTRRGGSRPATNAPAPDLIRIEAEVNEEERASRRALHPV